MHPPATHGTGTADGQATLEVTVTAPVVSFRNPLYASVQVCLPCPPPATVGGLLAAAAGGWPHVNPALRFAMAFHARGQGTDLETYHPLEAGGKRTDPTPRDRAFLADVTLTIWLLDDVAGWAARLRRPVWPLRLGRSQDLVGISVRAVDLVGRPGRQGAAILPAAAGGRGVRLRLPTAVSTDRARTHWDDYRFDPLARAGDTVGEGWCDPHGQAVVLLPPVHPSQAEPR
ncbi:CRISPR-associated protein Cas5 [Dactylosporangium sp. NPDC005555]|uniref:CRISPR-associated protein Cas5 n=1 Tax=Dactylosporangium sp. NPDC005555 TaxID=3154889 RepID=UPI0033AC37F2